MYAFGVRPEELCITIELISDSIKKSGDIEWRSQKDFLNYIEENRKCMEWKVIGMVSTETLKKWGKKPEIKDISQRNEKKKKNCGFCVEERHIGLFGNLFFSNFSFWD